MKAEDVVSDIRDMRKAIHRAAYEGKPITSPECPYQFAPISNNIARAVLNNCQAIGLSGEDSMTYLAYYMMQCVEQMYQDKLKEVMVEVKPIHFVIPDEDWAKSA